MAHHMSRRHGRSMRARARRNPEGGLGNEAIRTLGATALGVAGAIGLNAAVAAAQVASIQLNADGTYKLGYSGSSAAAVMLLVGVGVGVGLHVNDIAPRVGKAFLAGVATLAVQRLIVASIVDASGNLTSTVRRVTNSAPAGAIVTAPVMVSSGHYGYLQSGAPQGVIYAR